MWGYSVSSRVSPIQGLGVSGLQERSGRDGRDGYREKGYPLLLNYFLRSIFLLMEPEATDRTVDARLDGAGDDGHDGE